jgi:DNA-binding NtrC family response regulator
MKIQTDIECAITTEENVLISGGNSAARTALARLIHQRSSRDRSWVVLESNRPIEPPSEADEARLMPDAAGRTLFIEELAALDGPAQDDLMRLLESSADPLIDDVRVTRIISSTAHNPVERLAAKLFDTGLFYRLNTIHIALGDERRLASPTTVH